MAAELIERQRDDHVVTLILARPERRNALSAPLVRALAAAVAEEAARPDVRALVLTGAGPVFCAGGDLADGLGGADGALAAHDARGAFADLLLALRDCRVPVVAAVNGDALGGGFGLAMACDLVVADPAARMGTPEVRVGLFPMVILGVLLRTVPRRALHELVYTGERIDAERALALGLINRVSAPGAALAEAHELAATVASRSPAAIALGKRALRTVEDLPIDAALAHLNHALTLNLLTEDAMEGIAAFLGKRTPHWKGR